MNGPAYYHNLLLVSLRVEIERLARRAMSADDRLLKFYLTRGVWGFLHEDGDEIGPFEIEVFAGWEHLDQLNKFLKVWESAIDLTFLTLEVYLDATQADAATVEGASELLPFRNAGQVEGLTVR